MPPPIITPLPTPPTRTNPANFSERADHFLSALPNFGNQLNNLADYMNTASVGSIAAAESARDLALQYRDDSRSARDTALQHRNDAQTARTGAETAQGLAEDARTGAETAQGLAEDAAALANGMPLGTIMHFAADTPPSGWLVCDGTAVTALYPDLRAFLLGAGSPYGVTGADPRLPDLRGEFVRGWDGGKGVDPGRAFGSAQGDAVQDHSHLQGISALATAGLIYGSASSPVSTNRPDGTVTSTMATPYTSKLSDAAGSANARYADETRPRNIALLPCIRAYASVVNVPGQADLDNIMQQTQVQVDAGVVAATAAAADKVAWRRVGKVATPTGAAAVTLTGLDLTKETLFIVSFVRNSGTSNSDLRLRASEDGGSTWLPTWNLLSASANWNAAILRGAVELFPDAANGKIITSSHLSGPGSTNIRQYAPAEVYVGAEPVLTPDCDTVQLHWSAGTFAAYSAGGEEAENIIIYQRG